MDDADKKMTNDQQEQQQERNTRVLHLPDAQVGETETDEALTNEADLLVRDIIDKLLPTDEVDNEAEAWLSEQPTSTSKLRLSDERLQRILRLLDRYTRNLEAIEEHVRSQEHNDRAETVTQQAQPANSHSIRLDVRPKSNLRGHTQQQQRQQQQQQQLDVSPPCESRYHTITISTHSSAAFAAPPRPRTFLGRMWRVLCDLAGACCLCLQVNKDCVFCLGFFIAFVISASFLTAFFYRTIKLTHPAMRAAAEPVVVRQHQLHTTPHANMITLRINGGDYYVLNSHQHHFV